MAAIVSDEATANRLRVAAQPGPLPTADAVIGTLVEADFEKRTARLRTALGLAIAVHFDDDLDDAIHETLRHQAQLRGDVTFDPETLEVRSIRVRGIGKAEQFEMGLAPGDFWASPRPLSELATEQAAVVFDDMEDLRIATLTEEQRDQLVAAIGSVTPRDVPSGPLLVDTDMFSYFTSGKGPHAQFAPLVAGHSLALSFATIGELRSWPIRSPWGLASTPNSSIGSLPASY